MSWGVEMQGSSFCEIADEIPGEQAFSSLVLSAEFARLSLFFLCVLGPRNVNPLIRTFRSSKGELPVRPGNTLAHVW